MAVAFNLYLALKEKDAISALVLCIGGIHELKRCIRFRRTLLTSSSYFSSLSQAKNTD